MKRILEVKENTAARSSFWIVAAFYALIAFEFFYMASPFALFFYSAYGPALDFINNSPTLAWLSRAFLPHIVAETSSVILNFRNVAGGFLAFVGFSAFCIGAFQIYYHKITRKGIVSGGIYKYIRHPQYASFMICSFGLLILWPRYIVLVSFLSMLFAYYFLAKVEEKECELKFGQAYHTYKQKTHMFVPFGLPLINQLSFLSKSRLPRFLAIVCLYMVVSAGGLALAGTLEQWSLSSLYTLSAQDTLYVAVSKIEGPTFTQLVNIAEGNSDVQERLTNAQVVGSKFVNYVMPIEWYVSEIPMDPVDKGRGHYTPNRYDGSQYKIIFTYAELRADQDVQGKEILLNVVRRVPIAEVWIDLPLQQVIEIKNPPASVKYENIPVPVY